MPSDKFEELMTKKLESLDHEFVEKVVAFLRVYFTQEARDEIRALIDKGGLSHWIGGIHHGWGTAVRNLLRENGFTDDMLPDKNWDDYYGQMVEIAVGARHWE